MKFFPSIVLLVLAGKLQAQGGFRSRIYLPGAPDNQAKAIFGTSNGNYIAAGFAADTSEGPEINKLTIMKLDSLGKLVWFKQYGSLNFHYLNNQFITRSYYKHGGHIYYAGCVDDSSLHHIGVLIKFDLNGDTVWQRVFRDPDSHQDVIPQMVTASIDGGFLITGFFQHWNGGGTQCLLIKTDSEGKELWRKYISKDPPNVQDGKAVLQDSATKKIVIAGYQYPSGASIYHNLLILDSLGNFLSRDKFGPGNILDMIQAKDKSIYLTGYRSVEDQQNTTWFNPFVAKFDLSAPFPATWYKEIKPKLLSGGFSCVKEVPEGVMVCGWYDTTGIVTGFNNLQVRFVTVDKNGNMVRDRAYDYKTNGAMQMNNMSALQFDLTSDNGWVTAVSAANNPHPNPFFFVKYDSTGCDSTTAYCQSLTADITKTNSDLAIFEVFPNPAESRVNLYIPDSPETNRKMIITDIAGKTVSTLNNISSRESLDISSYAPGVYFLCLWVNGQAVGTKKLIVQP